MLLCWIGPKHDLETQKMSVRFPSFGKVLGYHIVRQFLSLKKKAIFVVLARSTKKHAC
jgi:hypothetical protein